MITIVSDLHLGIGDEREDFLVWGDKKEGPKAEARLKATAQMDELFAKFLAKQLTLADQTGITPMLVFLGDTFDFWQARKRRQKPADCLTDILSVHVEFVVAVRKWIAAGGEVTFVLGNHDQALLEDTTWNQLREIFPTANEFNEGMPTHFFADEASGLYAEHGHRWDPFNRFRKNYFWDAQCAGRMIVEEITNRLEPEFPIIDKLGSVSDIFRFLQDQLDPKRKRYIWFNLQRILRSRSAVVRLLQPWKEGKPAPIHSLSNREIASMNNGIERALNPKPGGTSGKVPANLKFFASGHTHEPLRVSTRTGIERFNPGSWTPYVDLSQKNISVTQNLPYATVSPNEEGDWDLKLGSFAKEARKRELS